MSGTSLNPGPAPMTLAEIMRLVESPDDFKAKMNDFNLAQKAALDAQAGLRAVQQAVLIGQRDLDTKAAQLAEAQKVHEQAAASFAAQSSSQSRDLSTREDRARAKEAELATRTANTDSYVSQRMAELHTRETALAAREAAHELDLTTREKSLNDGQLALAAETARVAASKSRIAAELETIR